MTSYRVPGLTPTRRDALLSMTAMTACATLFRSLGVAAAAEDLFKIGWVRPTTGRFASSYAQIYVGGLIAIDEINSSGGILGRKIERVEEDDEASPAKEPGIVKKLQEEGCAYIFGPTGTSQSLAALATSTPARIIQSAFALGASLGDGTKYPYQYQATFNTDQQAYVVTRYLVDVQGVKKIGILQENTAFGTESVTATRETLQSYGLAPAAIQTVPNLAPDLTPYLSNLQKAGVDCVILWLANTPSLTLAFNGFAALKWYPKIAGHRQMLIDAVANLVPDEAVSNVFATHIRTLTWSDRTSPGERQVAFAKKLANYPEVKGNEIVAGTAPFYDFLYLLKTVIETEKTFDTARVKAALDKVTDYPGLLGNMSFTAEKHSALIARDLAMVTLESAKNPKAMGLFRELAPGET